MDKTTLKALNDWVLKNGGQSEVSRLIGIRQQSLSAICRGTSRPSPRVATALQVVSDGALMRYQTLPEVYGQTVAVAKLPKATIKKLGLKV